MLIKPELFTNKRAGFTLLETMVAIGIIVIGLMSSLSLITNALSVVSNIQDRLIAANLAAEGIEVVRNIRDNNWLQNRGDTSKWNLGLDNGDYSAAYNSLALGLSSDVLLKLNPLSGIYSYAPGDNPTGFKRKISITNLSSYEIRVISTTTWQRKGITYNIAAEDHLFNWK